MGLYRSIARPLLFGLDAERAHELTLGALGLAGRLRFLRGTLRRSFVYADLALETEVAGIKFPNPVGLAAGFDKDCRLSNVLPDLGFGFVELGTVTPRAQPGNPKPRLFRIRESEAVLNRMGFNNHGAKEAAANLKAAGRCRVPLGLNLGVNKDTPGERAHKDYSESLDALRGLADYFVVNVSSPNTGGLRLLQSRINLERILTEVRSHNAERKPVFVKLAPDLEVEHLVELIPLILEEAQGLIVSNTTISREGVPERWATEPGGLSGAPVRERSTKLISEAYRMSGGRFPIIGVGGIFSAEDAWRKISAGASLVEVYTGLVYRGPGLVREINEGLAKLLRQNNFKSIAEAVGRNHPEVARK
ncbi:MAG: quinone-dependent dihydroorotate dehydrogenase [Elusimicrobia bacterium]|nr:quinone-dependent dihydroorotate dehydrogenase [Elusimicrobiota bacterium]